MGRGNIDFCKETETVTRWEIPFFGYQGSKHATIFSANRQLPLGHFAERTKDVLFSWYEFAISL